MCVLRLLLLCPKLFSLVFFLVFLQTISLFWKADAPSASLLSCSGSYDAVTLSKLVSNAIDGYVSS